MKILSEHCYQDQNITIYDTETKKIKYVEFDKYTKNKHFSFHSDKLNILKNVDLIYKDNMRNNLFKTHKIIKNISNIDHFDEVTWCYETFEDGYLKKESYDFVSLIEKVNIKKYNHQENHVLPSIFINNLKETLALSIDGKGDGNLSIFLWKNNKLTLLFQEKKFSYGMYYEIISSIFLKEKYYQGIEGKFMAYAGISSKMITINDFDLFFNDIINYNWNNYDEKIIVENKIIEYINILLLKFDKYDLAYTLQQLWIERILLQVSEYKQYSKNLVFSGGCSLNCMLNYKLLKTEWFKDIYWNPIASDSGQSIGSLYNYLYHNDFNEIKYININNYFCTDIPYDKQYYDNDIKHNTEHLNDDVLIEMLYNDKIIGVCRNNVEMGPRALGNRSILASPYHYSMHDKLNIIKKREWYRPYGIIIIREDLHKYFNIDVDAKYMNIIGYINNKNLLNGAMHIDGSVRIQTITKESNEWLYNLLLKWKKKTGNAILINTSLNDNGMPIFNWYEDIYRMYKEKLDAIVFDDVMEVKR